MFKRVGFVCLLAALGGLTFFLVVGQGQSPTPSLSSWPPDLTDYARPVAPDEAGPRRTISTFTTAALAAPTVVDVVVNNTNPNLLTTDTFNDGECTIAVNPTNPQQIVITAFSGGWGANAPLWVSNDGGATWTKQFTVPVPPGAGGAGGCPCDQAVDYGRTGSMAGTFLSFSPTNVYSGTTSNPASAASWLWFLVSGVTQRTNQVALNNADQPWLLVNRNPTNAAQDNVYVGYDDFSTAPDMRVAVAAGTGSLNFTIDNRSGFSTGSVNPGHRLAVDPRDGAVYSLFQRRIAAGAGGSQNINYMLNRSLDGGVTWVLNGSNTGIVVANADSTQPWPKFGAVNALLGGALHAAVDPRNGDVYYVYGNRDAATGNNRMAVRRLTTSGGVMTIGPELFVTGQVQAAIPSVAVAKNGAVGVFYYTFNGNSGSGFPLFSAHLSVSFDQGATFTDQILENFQSSALPSGNLFDRQRVLGDYMQLKAVNKRLYGVFTGNGAPFGRPISNHDPIFYTLDTNRPPTANAGPDATVNANANCQGVVTLNGTGSSDPDGDALTYSWTGPFGTVTGPTPTVTLPLGVHVIELTVTDTDGATATDTVTITVKDVTPPNVSGVSASPNSLWPPNHQFETITVKYNTSDNCSRVTCKLSVSSSEPINGPGDGNTSVDWQVVDANHVLLRAERSGGGPSRVYTITITCVDAEGNSTVKTTTVTVAPNQGK